MADDIEVHYDPNRGELSLSCGDESFARIRDAIVAAAALDETALDGTPAGIRTIVVDQFQAAKNATRLRVWLASVFVVLGLAVLLTLAVGLWTIIGWFR